MTDVLERLKPALPIIRHHHLEKEVEPIQESLPPTPPVYKQATEGQKFDIIFCTQEHVKTRFQYIHRLPDEEKTERRLRFGLEKTINCPFPKEFRNQPGFKTAATMTVRKIYGSPYFMDAKDFYNNLDCFLIKPGLVGANIKPEFFESEDYANNMAAPDYEREEGDRAKRQQILIDEQEQELNARYLLFIAYRIGLQNVQNIPSQVLIDIISTALSEPAHQDLPDIDSWKALHRKDVTLPPIRFGRDEEFDGYTGKLQASYVTQQAKAS